MSGKDHSETLATSDASVRVPLLRLEQKRASFYRSPSVVSASLFLSKAFGFSKIPYLSLFKATKSDCLLGEIRKSRSRISQSVGTNRASSS